MSRFFCPVFAIVLAVAGLTAAEDPLFTRSNHDGGPAPRVLTPAWSYRQEYVGVSGAPVVRADRLYGTAAVSDVARTFGFVYALDAATGKELWRTGKSTAGDLKGIVGGPALSTDGTTVVVGTGMKFDEECEIAAFAASDGAARWSVPINGNHVLGAVTISGDLVVVGVGAIERRDHIPVEKVGYVLGLSLKDGSERWRHRVIDPESTPAVAADGTIYAGSGISVEDGERGEAVLALRVVKGVVQPLWKTNVPQPVVTPITLVGDLVLAGMGREDFMDAEPYLHAGGVVACDRLTGQQRWLADLDFPVVGAVAVHGSVAVCALWSGEVVALDLASGAVRHRVKITRDENAHLIAAPAFTGEVVYAVSNDGFLCIVNLSDATAEPLRYPLNLDDKPGDDLLSIGQPLIAGGRVFVGSETGGLRCFSGK